jgi:chromosome segregation ATPase
MSDRFREIKNDFIPYDENFGLTFQDIDWLISELEAQSETLKWAKGEIEAKDEENEHLKHLRGKKNEAISEMEAEIDQIKDMLDACAEQRDAATNDIENLLDQIEVKERERDYYKIKLSQKNELIEMAQQVMDAAVAENKRMRKALDAIAEPKILDIYEACEIARQAL